MILIPKEAIAALFQNTATGDTRFHLQGVHVTRLENGKCRAQATDGHALLNFEWTSDDPKDLPIIPGARMEPVEGESYLVEAVTIKQLSMLMSRKPFIPILNNMIVWGASATETQGAQTMVAVMPDVGKIHTVCERSAEGQFPTQSTKLLLTMHQSQPTIRVNLATDLLYKLILGLRASGAKSCAFEVPIDEVESVSAVGIEFKGAPNIGGKLTGLLMPMRGDESRNGISVDALLQSAAKLLSERRGDADADEAREAINDVTVNLRRAAEVTSLDEAADPIEAVA